MRHFRHLWLALALSVVACGPALAQDASFKPGTVWNFSYIKVEPGQMNRYMDYLAGDWKKLNELGKREGYVVSYHVLAVNSARAGEPDLILAVESKDYYSNAEQLAQQKKVEALLAADQRKMEAQSMDRTPMRKFIGGMELQELVLK
ncbi:MAG: hypothetical protein ABI781_09020 [Burkholderiales bacterium]